jgi:hypothetical protein
MHTFFASVEYLKLVSYFFRTPQPAMLAIERANATAPSCSRPLIYIKPW